MPRPLFTPGKDPAPIVQEAGWASELVWIGVENLAPKGIRSPDRPVRRQSLYRIRYTALIIIYIYIYNLLQLRFHSVAVVLTLVTNKNK